MHDQPPFRADHVGSLLRPQELLRGPRGSRGRRDRRRRAARDRGRRDPRRRGDAGGRRACSRPPTASSAAPSWHMDFIYSLGGISRTDEKITVHFRQRGRQSRLRVGRAAGATAASALDAPIFADDFSFLKEQVDDGHTEADDPVAEHGALPRRPRGDRPQRLPGHRRVLGRPDRRLRRGGARGSASSAAPTCSSTTPASPTSTIPRSGR